MVVPKDCVSAMLAVVGLAMVVVLLLSRNPEQDGARFSSRWVMCRDVPLDWHVAIGRPHLQLGLWLYANECQQLNAAESVFGIP
jgi:hypothetical protein